MYNDITNNFYFKDNLETRKNNGIYITPYHIITKCLENEKISKFKNVLEPSFGSGQFIDIISEFNKNINIVGVELNNELYLEVKKKYSKNKNINLENNDFLNWENNIQFDLIIGNPPYFEIFLNNEQKKIYSKIICGRVNIYSLFIFKCINLLKPDGKLIFVIPTSLLSSKYFENIRYYIKNTCNIDEITILGSKDFEDALQSTMIFKITKLNNNHKSNNNFIIKFSNTIIFSDKYIEINKLIKNKKFIKDYNCNVKTGKIVWNQ